MIRTDLNRSMLLKYLMSGLSLLVIALGCATGLSAQTTHHDEASNGDLPTIVFTPRPSFSVVNGVNIWKGASNGGDQDVWDIVIPSGATITSLSYSGPIDDGSSVIGGFELKRPGLPTFDTRYDGQTYTPAGGIPGPVTVRAFVVYDGGGSNWTVTVNATVSASTAPSITTDPTSSAVCAGSTASFTAAASGTPAPTVQWQVNSGGGFGNVSGATSTTYSFTTSAGQNGNQYRAVFTNTAGSATSTAATLTVNQAPSITTHPTTQTVCEGYNLTLNAGASSTPAASVQWQVNSGGGFGNIGGATSTTYSVPVTQGINGNEYRAVFTNTCGSTNTNAATITVKPPVTLDVTLAPQLITSSGQFMQTINAIVSVQNGCSPTWVLESITSSDADAGTFPEDIADDIQGETLETADVQFQVRAEVTPLQDDRTYEVTYRVDDGTYSNTFTEAIIVPSGIGTLAPGGTNNCGANFGTIPVMTGGTVTIPFTLATASTVRLTIYNTKGKAVAGLINEVPTSAGSHTATWDGTNNAGLNPGTPQPNGYYFVLIEACNDFRGVAVLVVDR